MRFCQKIRIAVHFDCTAIKNNAIRLYGRRECPFCRLNIANILSDEIELCDMQRFERTPDHIGKIAIVNGKAIDFQRIDRLYRVLPSLVLQDRKSTRLNSSHVEISYAVFCLKKKKNKKNIIIQTKT